MMPTKRRSLTKSVRQVTTAQVNCAAKTGVTRLEIPFQQGDDILQGKVWQQIDIPSEILHHLRERNKRHFGQAHGTPFTVPPLSEDLGFTGQQPAAEAILKGEYSNADPDDKAQQ